MTAAARYDTIEHGYANARHPDYRLADIIDRSLGHAATVVNIGAGTGNYEPLDRTVIAVEPSMVMISQLSARLGPAVRGFADRLPFPDRAFDASLALSTIHHWVDLHAGLAEMARVAPRRVAYFSEPVELGTHWLVEYFPSIVEMPINRAAPTAEQVAEILGGDVEVIVFEVPADFAEGSAGAYWNRPEAYCDPAVQAAMSMFAMLEPTALDEGTHRLQADLDAGVWDDRHGHLREQSSMDLGYRIIIATEP